MGGASENKPKNHICVGILAHVDAGKTTLAEGLLYTCGNIRSLGRVDHKDAFLDNFTLERDRGITIFSKQAQIEWEGLEITLLDTPGHVDFSAEMERTLQVLDYAVLVISGADGVQGHVETLWRLLKRYGIPVFLFINKMDQAGTDKEKLLAELQKRLDPGCVEFGSVCREDEERADKDDNAKADGEGANLTQRTDRITESSGMGKAEQSDRTIQSRGTGNTEQPGLGQEETDGAGADVQFMENIALCQEALMEEYLDTGTLSDETIGAAVADREVFPCYFGSALRLWGVEMILKGIRRFCLLPEYPNNFGARVFKIARDEAGNRLTYLKVTGGTLRVKQMINNKKSAAGEGANWEEKADQLRIYSGVKYQTVEEVSAGGICAVTGLTRTFAGQGLGEEEENGLPVLEPVLVYRLLLPEGCDAVQVLGKLRQLEEEEPELHIVWKEELREIHVQVMGEVQIEILKSLIWERFGLEVEFGAGSIVYKETIAEPVEGIGHFEPLRHYAEVHLLLEPGERGSGLQFASLCSEDMLDKNWQRLVLTHLEEKVHVGVLTGSEITDMRILLVAGRAHQKHTEGGDFRQATYRAVRQGLRRSKSILLEPVFAFRLEVPTEYVGRAMSDIQRMYGSFDAPVTEGNMSILTGCAPVAAMGDYPREVNAYTRGHGRISCTIKGYEPCHNAEEVIAGINYDPEADLANPTSSVFCSHGAGFVVNWDQVEAYAHVESSIRFAGKTEEQDGQYAISAMELHGGPEAGGNRRTSDYITQEEIEEIFSRTYGKKKQDGNRFRRYHRSGQRRDDTADRQRTASAAGSGEPSDRTVRGSNYSGDGKKDNYLLVDGYNIIFAWEELRALAEINIDSARDRLMDIMSNYQGYLGSTLILVFDAYKVKGNPGSVLTYHNIYVVYTKEAETADQYIEKTVHEIGRKNNVTVATSDRLEQMIIWGDGAIRMSAQGLKETVDAAGKNMREAFLEKETGGKNRPFQDLLP